MKWKISVNKMIWVNINIFLTRRAIVNWNKSKNKRGQTNSKDNKISQDVKDETHNDVVDNVVDTKKSRELSPDSLKV